MKTANLFHEFPVAGPALPLVVRYNQQITHLNKASHQKFARGWQPTMDHVHYVRAIGNVQKNLHCVVRNTADYDKLHHIFSDTGFKFHRICDIFEFWLCHAKDVEECCLNLNHFHQFF